MADNDDTGTTVDGRRGDRLTLVADMARIGKQVLDPATGQFVSTDRWVPYNQAWVSTTNTVPTYAPGQTIQYQLTPTLTSAVPTGTPTEMLVEDCIPGNLVWEIASPTVSFFGTANLPYAPTVTCPAGTYYVSWILQGVTDTEPIPPITITAKVIETASSVVDLNTAVVSIPNDYSSLDQRTARARLQTGA